MTEGNTAATELRREYADRLVGTVCVRDEVAFGAIGPSPDDASPQCFPATSPKEWPALRQLSPLVWQWAQEEIDAPWVRARLEYLFHIEPPVEDIDGQAVCFSQQFVAVRADQTSYTKVALVCHSCCGGTILDIVYPIPEPSTVDFFADAFWRLVLSEPCVVADYSRRAYARSLGGILEFGIRESVPFFGMRPIHEIPFIAVPTATPDAELSVIAECFREAPRVPLIRGDQLPVLRLDSAMGPSLMEYTSWLISMGPDLLKDLAIWGLVTYGGKKFLDGFAVEAGKDFWKGVKKLGVRVLEQFQSAAGDTPEEAPAPAINVCANGAPPSGSPQYSVRIMIRDVTNPKSLSQVYEQIENTLFPIIGCLSLKSDCVNVDIMRESGEWPWSFCNRTSNISYGIDPEEKRFARASMCEEGDDDITEVCFKEVGLLPVATPPKRTWWQRMFGVHDR